MPVSGISIKGVNEFRSMLQEVSTTFTARQARNLFARALRKNLRRMLAEMKARVPIDSGFSKRTLKIAGSAPQRRTLQQYPNAIVEISVGYISTKFVEVEKRIAFFVIEYGSRSGSRQLELKVIRNAANNHMDGIFDGIEALMQIEVDKATAKQAAKLANRR